MHCAAMIISQILSGKFANGFDCAARFVFVWMTGENGFFREFFEISVGVGVALAQTGQSLLPDAFNVGGQKRRIKRYVCKNAPRAVEIGARRGNRKRAEIVIRCAADLRSGARQFAAQNSARKFAARFGRRAQHHAFDSGSLRGQIARAAAQEQTGGNRRTRGAAFDQDFQTVNLKLRNQRGLTAQIGNIRGLRIRVLRERRRDEQRN